jgi:mycofactocin precursor
MAPAPDSAVLEQPAVDTFATGKKSAPGSDRTEDMLLVEDLLVEEISIDGMCGVY